MSELVLWLTGKPASGKTTISKALCEMIISDYLRESDYRGLLRLDGDDFRASFDNDLGFSKEDRMENIKRAAIIARWTSSRRHSIVICSFVSPLESIRRMARKIIGEDRFFLVEVYCPTAVCEERDPKGLYALARTGEIPEFTGVSAPFDHPVGPDVIVNTVEETIEECVEHIVEVLKMKGKLP